MIVLLQEGAKTGTGEAILGKEERQGQRDGSATRAGGEMAMRGETGT